ncbi:MAG: ERF family protein [Proteobacteria bacterium]|nr:ERF family protein [Pseudomonadota bacterium]
MLKKLAAVQTSLVAPKGQRNSFGNYNYRSCEDILNALKPLQVEHGFIVTLDDVVDMIGDRYYIRARAEFTCTDTGQSAAVAACAREEDKRKGMDASKVTGSSSSYARKYALSALFSCDDTRDADAHDTSDTSDNRKQGMPKKRLVPKEKPAAMNPAETMPAQDAPPVDDKDKPTKKQWGMVGGLSEQRWGPEHKESLRSVVKDAGLPDFKQMTRKQVSLVIKSLQDISETADDDALVQKMTLYQDGMKF